ncbi:MAG TPA: pseudouridine synthase [Candidatus Tumulicola sp.]
MSQDVRINAYIARAGVASRRQADELVQRGKVRINGRVVRERGTLVHSGDRVDVSGTPIAISAERTYLVVHKPAGVMTTMRDPEGRRTIAQILPPGPRIVPVGRLDYETSGVLLLTNDGELANRLLHPRFGVEKTYRAVIGGRLSAADVWRINDGVVIGDGRTQAAKVRVVSARRDHCVVDITIHEGRNRQVRRMFEALGHPILGLSRLRFGPISLGQLAPGHARPLSDRERAALEKHRTDGS